MKSVYSYSEIENKYHILTPIERDGKRILICVNKKNSCYSFFVDNFTSYSKVDDSLRKELSKVYKKSKPGIWKMKLNLNFNYTDDNEKDNVEQNYTEMFEECKRLISVHLGYKNENFQKALESRLNTLSLFIDEKLIIKCKGYYSSADHSVHIKKNTDFATLLHEMLHAVSSKNAEKVGYEKSFSTPERDIFFCSGCGMTEGATQYHTELALGNLIAKIPCMYHHSVNLYYNLVKDLDPEIEKECFVLDKNEMLKEVIIKHFRLENDELYERLFYQIDAINCIENNFKSELSKDYINLVKNAYQTLIDMYQIKLSQENNFKEFDECISFDYLTDNKYLFALDNHIKKELSLYYENNMAYDYIKQDNGTIASEIIKFSKMCLNNLECKASDFPIYFKNTDCYASALNGIYTLTKNGFDQKKMQVKILNTLFNPANGFLPNDENGRKKFIEELLAKTNKERVNLIRMFPKRYIKFFVENKDKDSYEYNLLSICAKDPKYFIDELHTVFDSSIINSPYFIYGFQRILHNYDKIEEIKPMYEKFKAMLIKEYNSKFNFDLMDKEVFYAIEDRKEMQK